jgi:hypothetical protein
MKMRLINTSTLKLEDHSEAIPEYAILSHTWSDEEVALQDWLTIDMHGQLLPSLEKLEGEELLLYDGLEQWRRHFEVGDGLRRFGYWKILKTCL